MSLLYGGVYTPDSTTSGAPFVLTIVDSLGVRQVLRFREIGYSGARPAGRYPGVAVPAEFHLRAFRDADTVRLSVNVIDAQATRMGAAGVRRFFIQMRGRWRLEGRVAEAFVADSGTGFFETFVRGQAEPVH